MIKIFHFDIFSFPSFPHFLNQILSLLTKTYAKLISMKIGTDIIAISRIEKVSDFTIPPHSVYFSHLFLQLA
jgi:hypothetical protein